MSEADAEFARLAREYLDDQAERHPESATGLGDHRFDGRLADPSAQALEAERSALDAWDRRLAAIDQGALSAEHQVDAAMMANGVARRVFEIDELREHTWNPLLANPGRAIYQLLARDFAPLAERLEAVAGRLAEIPAVAGRGAAAARADAPGAPGDRGRAVRRDDRAGQQGHRRRARGRAAVRRAARPGPPGRARGAGRAPRLALARSWPTRPTASPTRGSGRSGSPASCRSR